MRRRLCRYIGGFLLSVLLIGHLPARAQMLSVGDPLEEYIRDLQLAGLLGGPSLMVRPISFASSFDTLALTTVHPWRAIIAPYQNRTAAEGNASLQYGLYQPSFQGFWNTARPGGMNDGAIWQGKGSTLALSSGAFLRYKAVSAAFRPTLIYAQNRSFELWPRPQALDRRSPFAHQRRDDIDLPQRFGADSFTTFDWGQSYIRLDYKGAAAGISNENMWWGPARQNAIIMSNNAPGFPHFFLGTSGPVGIGIGDLQAKWLWGWLTESEYFDFDEANNRRNLSAIVLDFQPEVARGLYLGAATTLMLHPDVNTSFGRDFIGVLKTPFFASSRQVREGRADRMVSLFGRYVMPESGMEIYFEWARGDTASSMRDLFVQPDHGRAYTLGFQKLFTLTPQVYLTVSAEHTRLESTRETGPRDQSAGGGTYYYVHPQIKQGYTQRGQIIGAGIGPGANSQHIGVDLLTSWGGAGLFGWRTVFDNDRYYQEGLGWNPHLLHEAELGVGVEGTLFWNGFELHSEVGYGRLLNQFWLYKNDHSNVNLAFSIRHALGSFR
jgi:hypothetical protein